MSQTETIDHFNNEIDFSNPDLKKVLDMVGGIDQLAGEFELEFTSTGKNIIVWAEELGRKIEVNMGKEAAIRAQDAFSRSSRLLAFGHLKQRGKVWSPDEEAKIINATNVIDTALDFATGRHQYPSEIGRV